MDETDKMEKTTLKVFNYSQNLIAENEKGVLLTAEGFAALMNEVKTALESVKNVKEVNQMYGSLALNLIGLGEKLSVGIVCKQAKDLQSVTQKDVLCTYCQIPFAAIEHCNRHLIAQHHEAIAQKMIYIMRFKGTIKIYI